MLHAEDVAVVRRVLEDIFAADVERLFLVVGMDQRLRGLAGRGNLVLFIAQHGLEFLRHVHGVIDEVEVVEAVIDAAHHGHEARLGAVAVALGALEAFVQLEDQQGGGAQDDDADNGAQDEDVDEAVLLGQGGAGAFLHLGHALVHAGFEHAAQAVHLGLLLVEVGGRDSAPAMRLDERDLAFERGLQGLDLVEPAIGLGEGIRLGIGDGAQFEDLVAQAAIGLGVGIEEGLVAGDDKAAHAGFHVDDVAQDKPALTHRFVLINGEVVDRLLAGVLVVDGERKGAQSDRKQGEERDVNLLDVDAPG